LISLRALLLPAGGAGGKVDVVEVGRDGCWWCSGAVVNKYCFSYPYSKKRFKFW